MPRLWMATRNPYDSVSASSETGVRALPEVSLDVTPYREGALGWFRAYRPALGNWPAMEAGK